MQAQVDRLLFKTVDVVVYYIIGVFVVSAIDRKSPSKLMFSILLTSLIMLKKLPTKAICVHFLVLK